MEADLAATCWSCMPVEEYLKLSREFADKVSVSLQGPMLSIFASLTGVWIVGNAILLAFNMTNLANIVKGIVLISITAVLLGTGGAGIIKSVYLASLDIMGGASQSIFSVLDTGSDAAGRSGLVGLAARAERAVLTVIQAAQTIMDKGALQNPAPWLIGILIVLPYLLLVVVYTTQVVVAIFRAFMIAVFAPFLFMAFAFGVGRGMAMAGAKTLLSSIMVLYAATAALALAIYGVTKLPIGEQGVSVSFTDPTVLVIMLLGWIGTALMTEATSIANSIAGSALSNTASGIMTAGATGTVMAMVTQLKKRVLGPLAGATGSGAMAAGGGAVTLAKNLFGSPNGPDPEGSGSGGSGGNSAQDLLNKFQTANQTFDRT